MLSRGLFNFDDDPFFSGHRERMRGLANGRSFGAPMLSDGHSAENHREGGRNNRVAQRRHGGDVFSDMMGHMQDMMRSMTDGMQMNMSSDLGNGHSYVQSSVYSYRNMGEGSQPEVYEAHHSSRHAPGGVREERKALRDSKRQVEKMAVGRHIGDRGHVVEKSRNTRSNETREHQNLIGLTDDEVESYNREWYDKTKDWQDYSRALGGRHGDRARRELVGGRSDRARDQPALEYHKESENRKPKRSKVPSKY